MESVKRLATVVASIMLLVSGGFVSAQVTDLPANATGTYNSWGANPGGSGANLTNVQTGIGDCTTANTTRIQSSNQDAQSYTLDLVGAGIPTGALIEEVIVEVCWARQNSTGAISADTQLLVIDASANETNSPFIPGSPGVGRATYSATFSQGNANFTPFVFGGSNTELEVGVRKPSDSNPTDVEARVWYISTDINYSLPPEPGFLAYSPVRAVPVGGGFMLIALGLLMAGVAFVVMRRGGTSGHMAAIMVLAVGGLAVSLSGANLVHKAWAGGDMITLDIPSGGVVDVPPGDWTFVNNTGIDQTIMQLRLPFCDNIFITQLADTPSCEVGLVLANGDMCTTSTPLTCPSIPSFDDLD